MTKQIEVLKARIADLESIEETHRKLNQELRKEIWQWKEKAVEWKLLNRGKTATRTNIRTVKCK